VKVVLDTSVLISAVLWRGICNRILKLAEQGQITICITPLILKEFQNVLRRPKFSTILKLLEISVEEITIELLNITTVFPDIEISPVVIEDTEDDKIVSCALTSEASVIVSGDDHLLKLKKYRDIHILSPRQFFQLF